MNLEATIANFKEYLDKINMLHGALSIMHFDASTGAPRGGADARAKRMGFLAAEVFAMQISDKMKGYLDVLGKNLASLDEVTLAMYRVSKRNYDKNASIPVEKMRKLSELTSKAEVVWEDAKHANDFNAFAPYLRDIIAMRKDLLAYRESTAHPYDPLLDDFEEGLTTKICDEFFGKLRASIVPLLQRVTASPNKPDTSLRGIPVRLPKQREISTMIARKIGYDLHRGMIRETEHPFCSSSGRDDVRITTHYYESAFLSSFYSVIHECGHAIYEQNKRDDIANTVLDDGISSGIHESQSRFYENVVGRSLPFWEHICEELKTYLPEEFAGITPTMFYEAVNEAKPSLIRVEADELTYCLHVMLRYEIEKMMFSSDVDVYDLPRIWNEKMQEYLGITPPDDTRGILQDVHWSAGLMGYFPT
ncbi:MAG: carboxypeptidase M32, partial [Defluviitaleaceae bacterium]|nr:carboxypeptidase M32 [Defluviitaleaceae bacterium]